MFIIKNILTDAAQIRKKTGDNLFYLRKHCGYSRKEIADKLGVSAVTYAKYERGTSSPSCFMLHTLAKLYDLPSDSIMEMDYTTLVHTYPADENGNRMQNQLDKTFQTLSIDAKNAVLSLCKHLADYNAAEINRINSVLFKVTKNDGKENQYK